MPAPATSSSMLLTLIVFRLFTVAGRVSAPGAVNYIFYEGIVCLLCFILIDKSCKIVILTFVSRTKN